MAPRLAGPDARPLLRDALLRRLTAVLIVVGGCLLLLVPALWGFYTGSAELLLFVALAGTGVLATAAVTERGWRPSPYGDLERVGVGLLALACALVAGYGAVTAARMRLELSTLGTAPTHMTEPLVLLACGLGGLTVLAVVLPLGSGRGRVWVRRTASATTVVALLAGAGSVAAYNAADDAGCSRFGFQPSRWQAALRDAGGDDGSRMAETIDRCDTIPVGTSRERALALLGRPHEAGGGQWRWSVADPEPGALVYDDTLTVHVDRATGRVTDVSYSALVD